MRGSGSGFELRGRRGQPPLGAARPRASNGPPPGDVDAELFERLDGPHDTTELVAYAEQRCGPEGPALLARLLADLGDRGLLVGVAASRAPAPRRSRLLRPRALTLPRAGEAIDALYRRGAWRLVTRPAVVGIAALALAGIAAFVRYGTPFVVARKIGLGAWCS